METKEFQILVIYDITNDKRRNKFARKLSSYGLRVQRSAFEMTVTRKKLDSLLDEIPTMIMKSEDNVRVYELRGGVKIHNYGIPISTLYGEVLIV